MFKRLIFSMFLFCILIFISNCSGGGDTGTGDPTDPAGGQIYGSVSITVTDGTSGIKEATVSTIIEGTTYTETTDGEGVAIFDDLIVGIHTFTAYADGYRTNSSDIDISSSGGSDIFSLTGAGDIFSLTVNTLLPNISFLSGATVSVTVNGAVRTAITNSSGVATFNNLPLGNILFTASMPKYKSNCIWSEITSIASANTISLTHEPVVLTVYNGDPYCDYEFWVTTYDGQTEYSWGLATNASLSYNINYGVDFFVHFRNLVGSQGQLISTGWHNMITNEKITMWYSLYEDGTCDAPYVWTP